MEMLTPKLIPLFPKNRVHLVLVGRDQAVEESLNYQAAVRHRL